MYIDMVFSYGLLENQLTVECNYRIEIKFHSHSLTHSLTYRIKIAEEQIQSNGGYLILWKQRISFQQKNESN